MATFWSVLRVGAGVLLLLGGVIGLVLPIIPGLPLLVAGLFLIGVDRPVVRPLMARLHRWGIRRSREADGRR